MPRTGKGRAQLRDALKGDAEAELNPKEKNQYTEDESSFMTFRSRKTLSDVCISKRQSSDRQQLAEVPEEEFEEALTIHFVITVMGSQLQCP
jgi:hypothetical protein